MTAGSALRTGADDWAREGHELHACMTSRPQGLAPAHRHVRPPQRRQVEPAQRADPPEGLDRLRRGRHHHRPGGKAHGAAAARPGAVHRHGRHRRRRRAGRTARAADPAGVRPHRPGHDRHRAGAWGDFEEQLLDELQRAKIPVVVVFNKIRSGQPDRRRCAEPLRERCHGRDGRPARGRGHPGLARRHCSTRRPAEFLDAAAILGDLVGPGELAVLVVPIDKEAPKGRLILPQVQAIRDLLDNDAYVPGRQGARTARRARPAEARRRNWS